MDVIALVIAGVVAVVAVLAYLRSSKAIRVAERSAVAAERSAGASERSAETSERSAVAAESSAEIERRKSAAHLSLENLYAKGDGQGGRVVFEIHNDGGSPAEEVSPQRILVNDLWFEVGGVAPSIVAGKPATFEGRSPSVVRDLLRAEIPEVTYVDALGQHREPLRWQKRPYGAYSEAELLDTRRGVEGSLEAVEREKREYERRAGPGFWSDEGYKEIEQKEKDIWNIISAIDRELALRREARL